MRAHIPLSIFGVIGLVSSIALLATFKPLYDFILEKVSWKIVHLFICRWICFVCLLFTTENVCYFPEALQLQQIFGNFFIIFHARFFICLSAQINLIFHEFIN